MFQNLSERSKFILVIAAGVIVLIAVAVLISVYYANSSKNQYGEAVAIQDLDNRVQNLPKERLDSITAALYEIIRLNSPNGEFTGTIDDAIIRKDSERQVRGASEGQYEGNFIVDIESIRQSYRFTYTSSEDLNDGYMSGYPTLATCLREEELIYGPFDCKDVLTTENEGLDPILQILPHESLNFKIAGTQTEDGALTLKVTLLLSEADRRTGEAAAVQAYKQEALDWMIAQGFPPQNYEITFVH